MSVVDCNCMQCLHRRSFQTQLSSEVPHAVSRVFCNFNMIPGQTRLSSRESAAGSVHRQDSTCPNLPMAQSKNVRVEHFLWAGGGGVTRTIFNLGWIMSKLDNDQVGNILWAGEVIWTISCLGHTMSKLDNVQVEKIFCGQAGG